jgi:hypothetical protein
MPLLICGRMFGARYRVLDSYIKRDLKWLDPNCQNLGKESGPPSVANIEQKFCDDPKEGLIPLFSCC